MVETRHSERGLRVDLFERQVIGEVWIATRMHEWAGEFWVDERATAYILSDEGMFLLKTVPGGDLGSGRRRDIEDMRLYARHGLGYESILEEIEKRRPFNSGSTETRHIRDRSHPLFTIETAVQVLSRLPMSFTERVSEFVTELEAKYFVPGAIDDGRRETSLIRSLVLSSVRSLSGGDERAVTDTITRLLDKQVIERDDDTLRLRTTESGSGAG